LDKHSVSVTTLYHLDIEMTPPMVCGWSTPWKNKARATSTPLGH
jgi:hypothetical protein